MELLGSIKTYDWGKTGTSSAVAQLAALNDEQFQVDANGSYAELWMGDHVSGPSLLKETREPLSKISGGLPYLFKVLSIRKALSIQVHPNKAEAERLHRERPDIYKDPNHKPEMAIALTPFVALCGFRPTEEIYRFCKELPPLHTLLGGDERVEPLKEGSKQNLKLVYEKLMTSGEKDVAKCIQDIRENHKDVLSSSDLLQQFDNVQRDFPNDVGVLSLFFMNLMRLQPGEAMFLGANEIHAYLSGDCVECMACSDNVIRAGLTPKYKDVNQLISCLNYEGMPAAAKLFQPIFKDEYTKMFKPPVNDFKVDSIRLPASLESYSYTIIGAPAILLCLQGERKLRVQGGKELTLKRGKIIYIPKESAAKLVFSDGAGPEDFLAYVAMNNQ